jgi:hypothetical protein
MSDGGKAHKLVSGKSTPFELGSMITRAEGERIESVFYFPSLGFCLLESHSYSNFYAKAKPSRFSILKRAAFSRYEVSKPEPLSSRIDPTGQVNGRWTKSESVGFLLTCVVSRGYRNNSDDLERFAARLKAAVRFFTYHRS